MNSENLPNDLPELPKAQFGPIIDQPRRCDDIDPAIPAHSIGATDPDEVVQINALLAECPRTAAELAVYSQLATRLLYSAPAAIAPARIADRLRSAIVAPATRPARATAQTKPRAPFLRRPIQQKAPTARSAKRLTPLPAVMAAFALQSDGSNVGHGHQSPAAGRATAPTRLRWYFGRALAVAAVATLVVFNVTLLTQNQQLRLQQQTLAADLAQQSQALILLAAEEPQEVEIFDPAGLSSARADVLWNNGLGIAVVYVRNFPQCSPGMTYQLWLVKDGQRTSGGLFSVDASGMGLLVVPLEQSLDAYDVIGITTEPAGGSPGPTSPPVVRGEI